MESTLSPPEQVDERAFFTALRSDYASVVPVVGAGMAVDAGAPSFTALTTHLTARARESGHHAEDMPSASPFDIIDALAADLGERWVNEETAALFCGFEPKRTPALLALSKVASGLIVTTNYDLSIEWAAEGVGRSYQTLTLDDFDAALMDDRSLLRVLHLHGVCTRPDTIVLTKASYERMAASEESALVLRWMGSTHRFVFLGHTLAPREEHLRREVVWSLRARSRPHHPHLLVTSAASTDDFESVELKKELELNAGVCVAAFPDPGHAHQAAVRASHAISPLDSVATADEAPVVDPQELDPHYLPLPMAKSDEVSDAGGRGSYAATVWQEGETLSSDLDTEPCLLIEAEGGAGKSQELLQVALRSPGAALVQNLRSFQVHPWQDAGRRFVTSMSHSRSVRPGTPNLTIDRLRDEAYTFLLDGLDEVAADKRPGLLRLLGEVARAYPQHRYVIASRPLPELLEDDTFARWTPMTGLSWVEEYATRRGVDPARLRAALPDTGDIAELIVIPIYTAAAVSRVYAGRPLPATALELVCDMVDERLGEDTRIEADPDSIRIWLDRLALYMQLAGTSELTVTELASSGLHEDLVTVDPTPDMLGELAARALLRDSHGMVRFPANVMKEARAARALLQAGERGLELLRNHVLIELGTEDAQGRPVRGVHPAWVNVLELLLPAATAWHEAIRPFDECLVARATRSDASTAVRTEAVNVLWDACVERKVWTDRVASRGNGSGDGDALIRLLSAGVPGFDATIRAAVTATERTTRGNAMELVPYVLPAEEAVSVLIRGVRDSDPVVRRRAAAAGWTLKERDWEGLRNSGHLQGYVDALADQAVRDDDELAPQTLMSVAIDLATENRAVQIATTAPGRLRERAMTDLASRIGRNGLLGLLRQNTVLDRDVLHELLEDRRNGPHQTWTEAEVQELAHIVGRLHDDTYWQTDAAEVLVQHPVAAVLALLEHPVAEELRYELGTRLLVAMDDSQMDELLRLLRSRGAETTVHGAAAPDSVTPAAQSADSGHTSWDGEAVSVMLGMTEGASEARNSIRLAAPERPIGNALAAGRPRTADQVTDDQVVRMFSGGALSEACASPRGDVDWSLMQALTAGAERNLPLGPEDAALLLRFLLRWFDRGLERWLGEQWSEAARVHVDSFIGDLGVDELPRLAHLLPGSWPEALADNVLRAVAQSNGLGNQRDGEKAANAAALVGHLGLDGTHDRLQEYQGQTWADLALIRLGDPGAEARLIAALASDPSRVRRHPHAFDEEWVSNVSSPSSAPPLAALIKAALQAGVSSSELEPLSRALERCAGLDVLRIWEELAGDPEIPHASFLVYDRNIALAALLEKNAPAVALTEPSRANLVRSTVPSNASR